MLREAAPKLPRRTTTEGKTMGGRASPFRPRLVREGSQPAAELLKRCHALVDRIEALLGRIAPHEIRDVHGALVDANRAAREMCEPKDKRTPAPRMRAKSSRAR
jgi:hypothetical protein